MWDQIQLHWRASAPPHGRVPEWLVTNGIGGFASGTTLGFHTRRYHGWLVASLQPPVRRTLMWVKGEEQLAASDRVWPLSTNDYGDGFYPDGWTRVHAFRVYPFPTTVFLAGGIVLERTIFMVHGQNTTAVLYRLVDGPPGVELRVEPLINCRDYHHTVRANDWTFRQDAWEYGVEIVAYAGAPPLLLAAGTTGSAPDGTGGRGHGRPAVTYQRHGIWFDHFHYAVERDRGLDYIEDHYRPGTFRWTLQGPGDVAVMVGHCPLPEARWKPPWRDGPAALTEWVLDQFRRATDRRRAVVEQAVASNGFNSAYARTSAVAAGPPGRLNGQPGDGFGDDAGLTALDHDRLRLLLAADDFIVRRETTGAASIIAGYPWFTDWGRDAMISLPGLLLHTGRHETAREVLLTFAQHRADGLIPNRFPDEGDAPVFNTVDASLWYVYAAWQYWRTTGDESTTKRELFPVVVDIVRCYMRGTRHGIGVDADGLVHAADPGLQLTWMDAKAGDWVVTPREGAPVEINALWYNALRTVAQLARMWAPADVSEWERASAAVGRAFRRRFVRSDGRLHDVVQPSRQPGGGDLPVDSSMRSNQILAASLPFPVLRGAEARRLVEHVTAELLTPVGLRTLSPSDPAYHGSYGGDQRSRDAAYHQGTVWPWLLGPYISAARQSGAVVGPLVDALLDPLRVHLRHEAALGHVSEIFEGDAPFAPRGCFAQAWSVAEWLRASSEEAEAYHDAGTGAYAHGSDHGRA